MYPTHNQPKFATIITARNKAEVPTGKSICSKTSYLETCLADSFYQWIELEIKLRERSQKLRVVPQLTGGAHYLFPTSETTLAVRVYDSKTIADMEEKYSNDIRNIMQDELNEVFQKQSGILDYKATNSDNSGATGVLSDFDGICSFRDSFRHTMVFFNLTNEILSNQLSRMESVVNTLQRCLGVESDVNLQKVSLY